MRNLLPLGLYLLSFTLLLVGERMFGPGYSARLPLALAGGLAMAAAFGSRVIRWRAANGETRRVLGKIMPSYAGGLAAFGIYALCAEGSPFIASDVSDETLVLLKCAFFLVALLATLPLVLMELSLLSMYGAQRLETRRLVESGHSGLALGLAISLVLSVNYLANQHDTRFDLRTLRDLQPSAATLEMTRNLSDPLTVSLFFSPANEVAEVISPYFAALADTSDLLTIVHLDKAASPRQARDLRVRKNGTVVVSDGENHESLSLGEDSARARSKLKKLDADFQTKLNKVTRSQRIAYFTVGHGERTTAPKDKDPRGLGSLKKGLKSLNYKVQNLGVKQGLSDTIPDDATLVFVVGPEGPMIESEQDALIRYVEEGGALFMLLDPEVEEEPKLEPLFATLGLSYQLDVLAHETKHVTRDRAVSDRAFLATNRFTTHSSTTNLAKGGPRTFALFDNTGSLKKLDGATSGADVTFTIRTAAGTWADLDGGLIYDKDTESKGSFNLAAAVQLPATAGVDGPGGRAVVAVDADALADLVLSVSMGNRQWLADSLRWLENEVQLSAKVAELEDVALVHTMDEDKAWFYGTTLGVPLLVLGFGLGLRTRRRRRSTQ